MQVVPVEQPALVIGSQPMGPWQVPPHSQGALAGQTHIPLTQPVPVGHKRPQAPQLLTSLDVSAQ
jgi:hypothetical protein